MPTVKGRSAVSAFIKGLPAEVEAKLLRGAARAGADVVAAEAKDRANSQEVKDGLKVKTRREEGRVVGVVRVEGAWARSLGIWAEYGTDPHYITVDERQREGRSIGRINKQAKTGTLAINGQAVGKTVFHPGARAVPFLRVSLDLKEDEARRAAQAFINARVTPAGITGNANDGEEDE